MHVAVKHRLACGLARVDANIERRDGRIGLTQGRSSLVQEAVQRVAFWLVQIKVIGHMPPRHGEQVPRRNWVGVLEKDGQRVLSQYLTVRCRLLTSG